MRRRDRAMEWGAGLLLPVLIALVGVLSYSSLRSLALHHGYEEWEANLTVTARPPARDARGCRRDAGGRGARSRAQADREGVGGEGWCSPLDGEEDRCLEGKGGAGIVSNWRWVKGSLVTKPVPAWGPGATSEEAVIVYVVDRVIVAALDERTPDHETWEAVAEWGGGLEVPVSSKWRTEPFGLVSPLPNSRCPGCGSEYRAGFPVCRDGWHRERAV
jgi:hypothetical protein